jgi:undecaprenyl-diphosphatase
MKMLAWISVVVICIAAAGTARSQDPQAPAAQPQAAPAPAMSNTQAALLGIVEGVTEYLPVSSTGHLILTQRLMGIEESEAADAFDIVIQAGAIVAVFGLYLGRVKQMIAGLLGRDAAGARLLTNIACGFVPAMVIGLAGGKVIKHYLFGLKPVVIAWFVGGVAILVVSWWRSRRKHLQPREGLTLDQLTPKMAFIIGFMQCLAMWPGTSRSLVTIVGGIIVGLSLPAAVEFSFLLGLLTLSAATAHDVVKHGHDLLHSYGLVPLVIGFVMAFIAAAAAIEWMVHYLQKHGLWIFGWYRVALAIVVAVLLWRGVVTS